MQKLLIANRGEIAVRIIRAAKELGVRTAAIYSDADEGSLHSKLADEAFRIGGSEPTASYLCGDEIIRIASDIGADAIHPGYGFLSESAEFAEQVARAGLIWVGPPAAAMRKLGAKIEAKKLAVSAGVPVAPGYFERRASPERLLAEAKKLGFPIMLKASGGGGGRGMRIVKNPSDFPSQLKIASEEASSAFGDGQMMVEKLIERPRHVEVQILADAAGTVAALFERECSLQRRHQKLIEEAPAPSHSSFWPRMRDAAIALAKAAGYVNAGTVEFMVDEESGKFYFLEVNARLQVEHPVTEAVTGLDLVQWQLRVASGERLDLPSALLEGDRSAIRGHAIEARIVAEDPAKDFLPGAGRIVGWAEPKLPGIRVDTGFGPGSEVSRHYDSLLAKVIAHAETREDAIARLEAALLDFHILGVPTNIAFTLDVLRHPEFRAGRFDTGFLEREFGRWKLSAEIPRELGAILNEAGANSALTRLDVGSERAAWNLNDGFRNARP